MPWAVRQFVCIFIGIHTVAGGLQAQAPSFPWEGEVSGTNVFVRSGAGANWYPTTKLNAGDRVLVLGEKYGWYQITPTPGSFSYIDMAMVDRASGAKNGTVKQDKVYVRAGSQLEQRKNATQLVLNKGDSVDIIGEAEGFYKINPPPGATLYISKQYVRPIDRKVSTGLVERYSASAPPQRSAVQAKPAATSPQQPQPVEKVAATLPKLEPAPVPQTTPETSSEPAIPEALASEDALEPEPAPTPVVRGAAQDSLIVPKPLPDAEEPAPSTLPTAQPTQIADATLKTPPSVTQQPRPVDPSVTMPKISAGLKPGIILADESPASAGSGDSAPSGRVEPSQNRYQTMLAMCESELVTLVSKPLEQQDPTNLLTRYEEIAAQTVEHVPAEVAKIRVRQLRERAQLRQTHLALHNDEKAIAAYRADMDGERMRIMRRRVEQALDVFDMEGELRRSLAFAVEERRYRLVDPGSGTTLAYVDIPRSVDENPDHLIGRQVGIKVAGRTFSPAARVPIAVASRIVDVSSRGQYLSGDGVPSMPAEQPSSDTMPIAVESVAPPPQQPQPIPISPEPRSVPRQGETEYQPMRPLEPGIHLAPESAGTSDSAGQTASADGSGESN